MYLYFEVVSHMTTFDGQLLHGLPGGRSECDNKGTAAFQGLSLGGLTAYHFVRIVKLWSTVVTKSLLIPAGSKRNMISTSFVTVCQSVSWTTH